MVLLIAIAYTATTIQGQEIKRKGIQQYVARVKEYGRTERRHSSFYVGLYGQTWVDFKQPCIELVNEFMKLNRNKRKYYQQGMRAMKLPIVYVIGAFVTPFRLRCSLSLPKLPTTKMPSRNFSQ